MIQRHEMALTCFFLYSKVLISASYQKINSIMGAGLKFFLWPFVCTEIQDLVAWAEALITVLPLVLARPLSSFIIFHQQVVIAAMSPFSCRWLMGSSLAPPHLQIVVASGSSCTKKGTHWSPSCTPQNPGCKAGRKARRTKPDKSIAGKCMENGWRMDHLPI